MNALQTLDVAGRAHPLRRPWHNDQRLAFSDGLRTGFRQGAIAGFAWAALIGACIAFGLLQAGVLP